MLYLLVVNIKEVSERRNVLSKDKQQLLKRNDKVRHHFILREISEHDNKYLILNNNNR